MLFLLYRAITWFALAAAPVYASFALARHPHRWRELGERFGFLPGELLGAGRGGIWIHAASVGELGVACALVGELARPESGSPVVVSVTTPAARRLLASRLPETVRGFCFPLDLPPVVARVVASLSPRLFIAVETEIWPNLFEALHRHGTPIALVNGRISDRSLPRYLRLRSLFTRAAGGIRLVLARSAEDASRFRRLGVPAERVLATGDLKFDRTPPRREDLPNEIAAVFSGRRVLVAGSTHPGEEEAALLAAQRAAGAGGAPLLVVLAPRHARRLQEVASLMETRGLPFTRRSTLASSPPPPASSDTERIRVLLLDTFGELPILYAGADAALLGGTFSSVGGHTPIEAAAAGVPVVAGPRVENVREAVATLEGVGGLLRAADSDEAASLLAALLSDPAERARRGEAARRGLAAHAGATARAVRALHLLLAHPGALPAAS